MPRSTRVITEAGLYHVVARGNNRQELFHEPEDYEIYLRFILKMKSHYDFHLYHYCLMPNHVHLLLRFYEAEPFRNVMQRVNLAYAKRFRKRNHYVGHVFQGRFKSFPVEGDSYLLECGRYIERNPVRARIVLHVADYRWSSAGVYLKGIPSSLIMRNPLYQALGASDTERQARYGEYLSTERAYESIVDHAFLRNQ